MNPKEEALVKEVIADLVPDREHIPSCVDLLIFGYPHKDCTCKCHKQKEKKVTKEKKKPGGKTAV